jgi:hypothetical protein
MFCLLCCVFVNFLNHFFLNYVKCTVDLARAEALTQSAAELKPLQPQPDPEPLLQPLPQQRTYAIATVVESPELGQVL